MKVVDIICPLYNAEKDILGLHESLLKQELVNINKIKYILTESSDNTEQLLKDNNIEYKKITKKEFSHSLVREKAAFESTSDILVFITQDIVIEDSKMLYNLTKDINEKIVYTYARQISKYNNIEKYTREVNYPTTSIIKSKDDLGKLGLNTFFSSDACAAIKTSVFKEINGYDQKDLPTNEDMYMAYKLIMNNYKIKYESSAIIYHSHKFTLKQLYDRYRLTGLFFKQNKQFENYRIKKSAYGLAKYTLKRILQEFRIDLLLRYPFDMGARYLGTFSVKKGDNSMKKKILVLANYFYPEVASTSQLMTELCVELQKEYDVTVICTVPCYTGKIEEKYKTKKYYYEELDGIKIIRVRVKEQDKTSKKSRIMHILSYFFNSIGAILKVGKQDVVYTISQPPVLGGVLGCVGKIMTKGKLVYNIQDFNPEQTMAVGYSKNKMVLKLMMMIDNHTCKKSSLVITVGSDMKETLEKRFKGKKIPNNVVINNWMNEEEVYPLNKKNKKIKEFKKKYDIENKFIIMYSGNIGLFYDLENLFEVFKDFTDKQIEFVFVGDGAIKDKLINISKKNNMKNITFIPYQDKKDLIYSLNSADVHLVVNAKGIKGVSCPSKIYGVLATNIPVFGILEAGTEAANIIKKSNCGIVAETGNYEDIKQKLKMIIDQKNKFVEEHSTGRDYLINHFTKDKSIEKYKEEIGKL